MGGFDEMLAGVSRVGRVDADGDSRERAFL